jgi:hypothetical protein
MTKCCKGYSHDSVLMELFTRANPCDMKIDSDHEVTIRPTKHHATGEIACTTDRQDCSLIDPLTKKPCQWIRIENVKANARQEVMKYCKIIRLNGSYGKSKISTTLSFRSSLETDPGFFHTESCHYWLRLV